MCLSAPPPPHSYTHNQPRTVLITYIKTDLLGAAASGAVLGPGLGLTKGILKLPVTNPHHRNHTTTIN